MLGYDLLELCRTGPIEKLNATDVSQPAIFVASLAALKQVEKDSPDAIANCTATADVVAVRGPKLKAVMSSMDRSLGKRLGTGTWDSVVGTLVASGIVAPADGSLRPRHAVLDPAARDAAKDAARRAGMTLGEWLNTVIAETAAEREGAERAREADKGDSPAGALEERLKRLGRAGADTSAPANRGANDLVSVLERAIEQDVGLLLPYR